MKETLIKILSEEDLKKRYFEKADSQTVKLTQKALRNGYSIAMVEKADLQFSTNLVEDIRSILEYTLSSKTTCINLWGLTDLSEFRLNTVYCAFKKESYPLSGLR